MKQSTIIREELIAALTAESSSAFVEEFSQHTVAAGVHLLRIGVHLERGSVTHPLMEPFEEEEGEM
ncbi:hypothetical protein F511_21350 [Dorcoceras hygrometricum]|uniref:Uncharacterized protein n=1 Tax=Dorcoceras hygrometricum TaxID=472368 RepID=A0A2Z7CNA3_9LAMI|nr:hypothetical protein F511_21350 [Dorcoceras hygrometricum]